MYSLFIDTHDKDIILCLYKNGQELDNIKKTSPSHHSSFIMPLIDELLKKNNINVSDLEEILVVNGPGSFTGIRLGVTIAKMLAYTLKINIKTITSLEVMMVSNNSKLPIIRDAKGFFGGLFKDGKLVNNYFYKSNEEFEEYIAKNNYEYKDEYDINFAKIYEYLKNKESLNPHEVNPIYIKIIEALKNDKIN